MLVSDWLCAGDRGRQTPSVGSDDVDSRRDVAAVDVENGGRAAGKRLEAPMALAVMAVSLCKLSGNAAVQHEAALVGKRPPQGVVGAGRLASHGSREACAVGQVVAYDTTHRLVDDRG
jgi:hypothetical protein